MRLNARTEGGGEIRVTVLDERGATLPGLSLDNADPIRGDSVDFVATWRGDTATDVLSAQPVRLRIEITRGELFAVRCAPAP